MNPHSPKSIPFFSILFIVLAIFLGSFLWPAPVRAATVTVTDCSAPSGAAGRLVETIAAAAPGDTVNFSCSGTITLAATLILDKNLTIDGSGQTVTISGGNLVRVLIIDPGMIIALNQLTLSGGTVTGPGGGIVNQGDLTVSNSTISGNSATTTGGGIYSTGTLMVTNSTVSGNSATNAGGIFNGGTLATVTNSTISSNSATTAGGGLYNNLGATLTVSTSTLSSNNSPNGAGIYNRATLTVSNSTIAGNTGSGGVGIYNQTGAALTIANSTFSGNNGANGGGIQNRATASITNSTFSGNTATNRGGAIMGLGGVLTIINSTISGNSAANITDGGGGIYSSGTLNFSNTIIANSTSVVECFSTTIGTNLNNQVEDGSCAAGLSGDPNLGALANNGGLTQTFAPLSGSSAIDAGDDTTCGAAPVNGLDQRGASRWQGAHCDIGAYEKSPTVVGDCSGPDGFPDRLVDVITAAPAGDTVTFSCSGTIILNATITLDKNLTIDGSGQTVTISGGNLVRVFYVNSGVTATLNNLTIADGYFAGYGAGIINWGNLTVTNSTFSGNSADNGGGGIQSGSYLTVTNSTFSNNSAGGDGGGIRSSGYAMTVTNSTFSGNAAIGSGGGFHNTWGTLSFANTIVANSTSGGDCYNDGTLSTNINNLVEDGSCAAALSGDPNLGTLANNGGPTQTFALLTGSTAIDAGDDTTCAAAPVSNLDQRGAPRPQGAHCDIGAFEKVSTIVTNINNSGSGSLRNALDYSAAGETITFAPGLANGVIILASTLTLSRDVTVDGSALAAQISVSGDANNNNIPDAGDVRVFYVNEGITATLDSLKIINGYITGDAGGGIYVFSGSLTLKNSTLSGNSADVGGGLYNFGGNVTVENSTLSGNAATSYGGGGIYNAYGLAPGTLTVQNSTLSGNTATSGTGGAIFNDNSSTLSVVNSTLSGNAAINGGAIANQDSNAAMIRNSTLSGNTASGLGGGIFNDSLYAPNWWTTFGFVNTIVANSTNGGDCYNSGTISTNTNNLVEDGSCAAALSGDPNLGALADNGGPTQTFALLVGSPAMDAGDNAACAAAPVNNLDQRGAVRPQGPNCDIGAYEAAVLVSPGAGGGNGPGGVGITDGSSALELWLRADRGITLNGSNVSAWADQSGNAINFTAVDQPAWVTNVQNSQPVVRFGGFPQTMASSPLTAAPPWKIYLVLNATAADLSSSPLASDSVGQYSLRYGQWNTAMMGFTEWSVSDWTSSVPTPYGSWAIASWAQNVGTMTFNNGTSNGTLAISDASGRLPLGQLSFNNGTDDYEGDLSEVAAFTEDMPLVRQILVENYLSAKYNLALSANDVYDGDADDPDHNFDLDMAGIGRYSGNNHTQAHSVGMIVVNRTFLLDDGDWLTFGHRTLTSGNTTTDLPTTGDWASAPAPQRWTRHWYFQRTDAGTAGGTVDIIFDFSEGQMNNGGASPTGPASNYRLLKRADGVSQFSDIATATAIINDQVQFIGVDVTLLGSNFTLGTLNGNDSPTALTLTGLKAGTATNNAVAGLSLWLAMLGLLVLGGVSIGYRTVKAQ